MRKKDARPGKGAKPEAKLNIIIDFLLLIFFGKCVDVDNMGVL